MEKIVAVPENELRWLTTLAHKYLAYEELLNNYTCEAEKSEAMDILEIVGNAHLMIWSKAM